MRHVPPAVAVAVLLIAIPEASAQDHPLPSQPVARTGGESMAHDMRRQGSDDLVGARRELEIATEMAFVTSRGTMIGVPELFFTDVGLWRSRIAYTPLPRLRLTGAVGFAAKHPATMDEKFWQSAALGVHFHTSKRTALALSFDLGNLLADAGVHGSVGLSLQGRKRMNEFVSWEGRLGGSATHLWYDADTDDPFWFAEAGGSGEVQLCWGPCHRRHGASWFGIALAVPVYHQPEGTDATTGLALDPHTRLDVTLGTFVNITPRWDMYMTVAWIDRGDAERPETQLPILDGGFDQVQLSVGIVAHFSLEGCAPGDRGPDCPRQPPPPAW